MIIDTKYNIGDYFKTNNNEYFIIIDISISSVKDFIQPYYQTHNVIDNKLVEIGYIGNNFDEKIIDQSTFIDNRKYLLKQIQQYEQILLFQIDNDEEQNFED